MNQAKSKAMLLDKPVCTMTAGELLELIKQCNEDKETNKQKVQYSDYDYLKVAPTVTGLKELARVLNISVSTISRWKAGGLLDDATFQNGKTVVFDTHKVLEILRVSNRKKFNRK